MALWQFTVNVEGGPVPDDPAAVRGDIDRTITNFAERLRSRRYTCEIKAVGGPYEEDSPMEGPGASPPGDTGPLKYVADETEQPPAAEICDPCL